MYFYGKKRMFSSNKARDKAQNHTKNKASFCYYSQKATYTEISAENPNLLFSVIPYSVDMTAC